MHMIVIVNIEKIIPNKHVINNGKHLLFNKLIKIKIKGKAKKRNPRIKEKIIINNWYLYILANIFANVFLQHEVLPMNFNLS